MKNTKMTAGLAALLAAVPAFGFASSKAPLEATHIDIVEAIKALRGSARVAGDALLHTEYEDPAYAVLSYDAEYYFDRVYGTIDDGNGKTTKAVRDMAASNPVTYYKGENNNVWTDYLMPDNTVQAKEVYTYNMPQAYDRVYTNPWDYISERDISDDLTLAPQKATLLLNDYMGLDFAVNEATVSFNSEGLISRVDFDVFDKPGQVTVGFEGTTDITQSLEVSFTFDYTVDPLTHLPASTDSNPELREALGNMGNNYTAYFTGSQLGHDIVFYVTEGAILLHNNPFTNHLLAGDMLYVVSSGTAGSTYTPFTYDGSKWVSGGTTLNSLDNVLPRFSQVSDAIFDKVGNSDTYALKPEATTYSAGYLSLPDSLTYATQATGTVGSVTVRDGHVAKAVAAYELGATCTGSFSDYGTTQLPAWFDIEELQ